MKQVRQGLFETNSSSVHSLSIRGKDSLVTVTHLKGEFGEFGWGYERLEYPDVKLSYILTGIVAPIDNTYYITSKDDNLETFEKVKHLFLNSEKFKWLNEAVLEVTGEEIYFDWDEIKDFGYIDHQSMSSCCPDALYDFWSLDKEQFQKNMIIIIFKI